MKKDRFRLLIIIVCFIFCVATLYISINNTLNISLYGLKDLLYKPFTDSNNKEDIIGQNFNYEIIDENDKLKNLTEIDKTLSDFEKINATVIERNHSYWLESMTINKGKSDGIDIGDAVVTSEGLVGKIDKITNNTSVVKLITSSDNKNKISVKIKYNDTYLYKILEHENGSLVINGVDNSFSSENEIVLTSGLSDLLPSGITVGKIDSIKNDKYGVSKILIVKSLVNFDNIRFVTVLRRNIKWKFY